jgi:omega-amidase
VVAAQIEIETLEPEKNLLKIGEIVHKAGKEHNPDLIVFPELCNSGYVRGREQAEFKEFSKNYFKTAEKIPGLFTQKLCEHARDCNVYLAIGLLEAHPIVNGTLFNSAILIDPKGEIRDIYRKVHIPGEEKHFFYSGNQFRVLKTEIANMGIMICADNSFPESARILTLKGAEIICVLYARPRGLGADAGLYARIASCRAYENNNFLIACNRVGIENGVTFEGRSCICGPDGGFLAISEQETEEIIWADLKAEALISSRMRFSRFRDRRPDVYRTLSLSNDDNF